MKQLLKYWKLTLAVLVISAISIWMYVWSGTAVSPVSGDSMSPTIPAGASVRVDKRAKPVVNDIVLVYGCDKCIPPSKNQAIPAKRVTKINEQGCLWLNGDNENMGEGRESYDSDHYGWVCKGDYQSVSVVTEIVK